MRTIRFLPENTTGRDFVVGDIHGCFNTLNSLLEQAGFDPQHDRLLSVGDLVDRGPDSATVLTWLAKPWLYAVRGNHEQMAIDFDGSEERRERYQRNGGDWFMSLPEAEKQAYRAAFSALPLAMQVRVGERDIGIIHADCPDDNWQTFQQDLANGEQTLCRNGHTVLRQATWCRERIRGEARQRVSGIDLLCVGHTPVDLARQRDNVLYLDTGAVYCQHLTLLCLQDMSIQYQPCSEGIIEEDD